MSTPMFEALAFALGLPLVAATLALACHGYRQGRRVTLLAHALREEQAAREELARDVAALLGCSREIGQRLRTQTAKQKSVAERVNELTQQLDGTHGIAQAERLMADGMDVEQVRRLCELSQGEAALLERWNNRRRSAA